MSILSGFKKYKDYIFTGSGYQLSSRWTKSDAVIMGDGTDDTNTLEKNLGSIQGITDSLTATSSNIALSAAGGKNLQGQIENVNIYVGEEDGKLHFVDSTGADSVLPFKSGGDYTRLNQFTCSLPTTSVSNSGSGVSNSSTSAEKTVYKIPAGSTIKFTYSTTVSANGWVSAGLYMNGSSIVSTGQVTSTISSKSLTYVVPETIEDAVFYSKCKNGSATGASGTFAITIKAITITLPA